MDKIKKHFEEEAEEFDQIILRLIPYYRDMVDAIVLAIPFDSAKAIKVIDLGCGTGTISRKIKEKFKNAKITCLDLTENMIKVAKFKMQEYTDTTFIVSDFYDFRFDVEYDVVVSSLALHHLKTDNDKKDFYKKVFKNLSDGGVFYNADVVLGSNDYLQKVYMTKWKEFMSQNVSVEEIENKWIPKYREEDKPVKLIDQLHWLIDIGFNNVDVIWKYYNFAVYGASKVD